MTHKLIAAIQVGPDRYGLYSGDRGLAWYGPPGPALDLVHQTHADYKVNRAREKAEYSPAPLQARVEYMAETLGGHIIILPAAPSTVKGRIY